VSIQSHPSTPSIQLPVAIQSHPSTPGAQLPVNVATTADIESLRKELTHIVQSEIATAKRDILDGKSKLWLFPFSVYLHFV